MSFAQPLYLYALVLLLPLCLFLLWAERRRSRALARLGDTLLMQQLSASLNRRARRWQSALRLFALGMLVLALARPQWGSEVQMVEQKGVQVMVALDVSPSMLAQDVKPDRLSRAKMEIVELMDALGGDEIGLILFSGASFLQFPLTTDYATARSFVDAARPEAVSRQGTAIGEAIETALRSFNTRRASQKVLVLLTDGEDHASNTLQSARKAAEQGVLIYAIGFGTPQGAPIPLHDEVGGVSGFLKDRRGEVVISRLDEAVLQRLAQDTNARYYRASASGLEIRALAGEIKTLKQAELSTRFEKRKLERFQWFLAAALLALLLAELLPQRLRSRQDQPSASAKAGASRWLATLLVGWVALNGLSACTATPQQVNNQGNQAYARKDYEAALNAYQRAQSNLPEAAQPVYNAANAHYRQGDFTQAQQSMAQALQKAHDDLAQSAFYNLGNVLFQSGQFAQAVEAYKNALRLKPDDLDAKANLELALQKQQQQEQQQQQAQNQPNQAQEQKQDQSKAEDQKNQAPTPQAGQPNKSQQPTPQAGQPNQAQQATPQGQVQGGQQQPGQQQAQSQQAQGLSEEQARQLLEAAAQDTVSLQDVLRDQNAAPLQQMDENW